MIVVSAALLTLAVTLSLTAYACTTKTDITMMGNDNIWFLGGALWIIFAVLIVTSVISIFNTSVIVELIISSLVIICYGFYLIYDTQLIMGGKVMNKYISIESWIINWWLCYRDDVDLHRYNYSIPENTLNNFYIVWEQKVIQ